MVKTPAPIVIQHTINEANSLVDYAVETLGKYMDKLLVLDKKLRHYDVLTPSEVNAISQVIHEQYRQLSRQKRGYRHV